MNAAPLEQVKVDYLHLSFKYGDYSAKALGNVLSPVYGKCYTDSYNFVNELSGTARKRNGIKLTATLEETATEVRSFTFFEDSVLFIMLLLKIGSTVKAKLVNVETSNITDFAGSIPDNTADSLDEWIFSAAGRFAVLTHPLAPPILVSGNSLSLFPFFLGPVKDENNNKTALLTASATGPIGSDVTITATEDTFVTGQEGGIWAITEPLGTNGAYTPWQSGVAVNVGDYRRNNNAVYLSRTTGTTGNIPPIHFTDGDVRSDGTVEWLFINFGIGYFFIKSVTDSTHAVGTVQRLLPSTVTGGATTYRWNEGAFSLHAGFPAFGMFSDGRSIFLSNKDEPVRIWGSRIDDEYNYDTDAPDVTQGTTPVGFLAPPPGSFALDFTRKDVGKLHWAARGKSFYIGSDNGMFALQFPGSPAAFSLSVGGGADRRPPTIVNQYLVYTTEFGIPKALTDTENWIGAHNLEIAKTNPELASGLRDLCSVSSPDTFFGIKNGEIIFKSFDESFSKVETGETGIEVYGYGRISNPEVSFKAITTYGSRLFVAGVDQAGVVVLGEYIHAAVVGREEDFTDFGTRDYEASLRIPRASVLANPGIWAGGLKQSMTQRIKLAWLNSGPFRVDKTEVISSTDGGEETDENGNVKEYGEIKEYDWKTQAYSGETDKLSISEKEPVVLSYAGAPCILRSVLFTFTPVFE